MNTQLPNNYSSIIDSGWGPIMPEFYVVSLREKGWYGVACCGYQGNADEFLFSIHKSAKRCQKEANALAAHKCPYCHNSFDVHGNLAAIFECFDKRTTKPKRKPWKKDWIAMMELINALSKTIHNLHDKTRTIQNITRDKHKIYLTDVPEIDLYNLQVAAIDSNECLSELLEKLSGLEERIIKNNEMLNSNDTAKSNSINNKTEVEVIT